MRVNSRYTKYWVIQVFIFFLIFSSVALSRLFAGTNETNLCDEFLAAAYGYLEADQDALDVELQAEALQAWDALDAFHKEMQKKIKTSAKKGNALEVMDFVNIAYPGLIQEMADVLKKAKIKFEIRTKQEDVTVGAKLDPLSGLSSLVQQTIRLPEIVIIPQTYNRQNAFWPLVFAANILEYQGVSVAINPFMRWVMGSDGMAEWDEGDAITAYPNNRSFPGDGVEIFTIALHEAIHAVGFKKHASCKNQIFGTRISTCDSSGSLVSADEFRAHLYTISFLLKLKLKTVNPELESKLGELLEISRNGIKREIENAKKVYKYSTDRIRRHITLDRIDRLSPDEKHAGSGIEFGSLLLWQNFGNMAETGSVRISLYTEATGLYRFSRIYRGKNYVALFKEKEEIERKIRLLRSEQDSYYETGAPILIQDGLYTFSSGPRVRLLDPKKFKEAQVKIDELNQRLWEIDKPIWQELAKDFFSLESFINDLEPLMERLNYSTQGNADRLIEEVDELLLANDPK